MARQSGLGPLGHAAIQRAVEAGNARRAPVISERPNPAAVRQLDPGELQREEGLNWLPFDSSRVNEAAYDTQTKRLYVNFVRPTPGQDEYVYEGVENNEWRNFRRSASPGKYIDRVLNYHDYHRVN